MCVYQKFQVHVKSSRYLGFSRANQLIFMLRLLETLKTSRDLLSDRQIGSAGASSRGNDIRVPFSLRFAEISELTRRKRRAGAQITQARFKHCKKYMNAHGK
jgi:hypothetical protein